MEYIQAGILLVSCLSADRYDGTSRHLSYFDQLKEDEGYTSVIENSVDEMASSHQVKRFFQSFSWLCGGLYRKILKQMFIWRLKIEKPEVIELTADTMVIPAYLRLRAGSKEGFLSRSWPTG